MKSIWPFRRFVLCLVGILALPLVLALAVPALAQQTGNPRDGTPAPEVDQPPGEAEVQVSREVEWVQSLDAVNERARQDNKLIFAYFYATWCPYCRQYDQTIPSDPSVLLLIDEFVPTRVDGDRMPDLKEHYKVAGYPATVLVDADGKEVSKLPGLRDPGSFATWLGESLAKHSLPRLEQQAKANPEDLRLVAKMAVVYAYSGDMDKAATVYNYVTHKGLKDAGGLLFPIHRAMAAGYGKIHKPEEMVRHLLPQFEYLTHPVEKAQACLQLGVAYRNLQQWELMIAPMQYVAQAGPSEVTVQQRDYAVKALQDARMRLPGAGN